MTEESLRSLLASGLEEMEDTAAQVIYYTRDTRDTTACALARGRIRRIYTRCTRTYSAFLDAEQPSFLIAETFRPLRAALHQLHAQYGTIALIQEEEAFFQQHKGLLSAYLAKAHPDAMMKVKYLSRVLDLYQDALEEGDPASAQERSRSLAHILRGLREILQRVRDGGYNLEAQPVMQHLLAELRGVPLTMEAPSPAGLYTRDTYVFSSDRPVAELATLLATATFARGAEDGYPRQLNTTDWALSSANDHKLWIGPENRTRAGHTLYTIWDRHAVAERRLRYRATLLPLDVLFLEGW